MSNARARRSRVNEAELAKAQREKDITELLDRVRAAARDFEGLTVAGQNVNLGPRAQFDFGTHELSGEKAVLLRAFVPRILAIANDPLGQKWFKRIVVEGFTVDDVEVMKPLLFEALVAVLWRKLGFR